MKTVKLLKDGHMIDGVHRKKDDVVLVVDEVANDLVKIGSGEVVPAGEIMNDTTANRLAEVVTPFKEGDDPLQAARLLSSNVPQHPGLVAHAEATGAPKRQGRMVPDATTVVDVIPDASKAAKPVKV